MHLKMVVLSNWKVILLLLQAGLLAIALATGTALAEPVNCPGVPI